MGVVAREPSGCDSPSCFSSSSPCSSSPSAGGSRSQSRQREISRRGRNRERNLRDPPSLGRNHLEVEVENQSLPPSTMQSGQKNQLVALVGGIWLARTVPFVRRAVCSVDTLCRTNATKNIPLRDAQEFKATL